MDKIAKALNKLGEREKRIVADILTCLKNKNWRNLDVKKLKGASDIFRARKGKIRLIYRLLKNDQIIILAIERRSETTYKKFQ
jgi:mRNA-degrading endonuclease RelE of RelBE toxin-antitoxin system